MARDLLGRWGESLAAAYLQKNHYTITAANSRSRFGEIDLIFTKRKYIVFVEVKARGEGSIAEPKEFVDENKMKKIIATAQLYMSYKKVDLQPRFDIVEVFLENDRPKSAKHLENAFTLD